MQAEVLREVARRGAHQQRPVGQLQGRAVLIRRSWAGPARGEVGCVERDPLVADLVAREEVAQRTACGVPAVTGHRDPRLGRFGRDALQPAYAFARELPDLHRNSRRYGGDGVVLLRIDAHDARGLRCAIAADERRAEDHRHFAEDAARSAPTQAPFDAVDHPDDLDLPGEHRIKRAISSLGDSELPGAQMHVCRCLRQSLEFGIRECGEQGNGPDVVDGEHVGEGRRGSDGSGNDGPGNAGYLARVLCTLFAPLVRARNDLVIDARRITGRLRKLTTRCGWPCGGCARCCSPSSIG